jgi:hypothetical protein
VQLVTADLNSGYEHVEHAERGCGQICGVSLVLCRFATKDAKRLVQLAKATNINGNRLCFSRIVLFELLKFTRKVLYYAFLLVADLNGNNVRM